MVLKITRGEASGSRVTLRLDGSLLSEWAEFLEHECRRLLRTPGAVRLDLRGVNFVDRAGVEALARLSQTGVEVHCRPGPVANVLAAEGIRVAGDADGSDGEDDDLP